MVLASAWADGRSEAVYGHVITKFSVMRRFTFLWRAFRALESSAIAFDNLLVVILAPRVLTNQSAAKIFSTNQNRAFRSGDSIDVTMPIFGHEKPRDPMG